MNATYLGMLDLEQLQLYALTPLTNIAARCRRLSAKYQGRNRPTEGASQSA
jgi:hypothetical protein